MPTMESFRMQVRFWGVRGSIPAPGPATSGFGGNTSCVEIVAPGAREALVFDAGSGIRALGYDLLRRPAPPGGVHLVFTHFHWDHVQGLPFFPPLFREDGAVHFHATCEPGELQHILEAQMRPPYFPFALDATPGRKTFSRLESGCSLDGVGVEPFPLRHPQPCSGYRIAAGGAVAVYATDTELGDPQYDGTLIDHCRGADVLICDAQNTVDEEDRRRGWGHSSWRQAAAIAAEAGVGELVLFHHDPGRTDAEVDDIVLAARAHFPRTRGAREGEVLAL